MNEGNMLCTPNETPQMTLKDIIQGAMFRKDKHCTTPLISGF
jgi:hypothetical protein